MSSDSIVKVPVPRDIQHILSDIDNLRQTEEIVEDALETFRKELAEEESVHSGLSELDHAEMDNLQSTIMEYLRSAEDRVQAMCSDLETMHTALTDIVGKNNALMRKTSELGTYLDGLERFDLTASNRRIRSKIQDIQDFLVAEQRVGKNNIVYCVDPSQPTAGAAQILHVRVGSVDGSTLTLFEAANKDLFTSGVFEKHATLLTDETLHKRPDNTDQWRVAYVSRTGEHFEKKHKETGLYNLQVHRPGGYVKLAIYGLLDVVQPGEEVYLCLGLDEVASFEGSVVRLF
jgi:hypothetical protein